MTASQSPATRSFALLATLDTKVEEPEFLRERFRAAGRDVVLIDIGTRGEPGVRADITRDAVAAAGGHSWDDVLAMAKTDAMAAMADGAARILGDRLAGGDLAGVLGIGGGQGTCIAATAMRTLELGVPKVVVTTVIHRAPWYVGASDIVMIPSITDITGLNRILAPVLAGAVNVVIGLEQAREVSYPSSASWRPLFAMTMFGVTTRGGNLTRQYVSESGREVAVFHANGIGGRIMESLVSSGGVAGVLDWTTTELADELVGGIASAGPHRLEAATRCGIPQLIVPGAMDIVNFGPAESVPQQFAGRLTSQHTPTATLMRTSPEESGRLGQLVANKLACAPPGSVAVLIPTLGFSGLSAPDGPFADPVADREFIDALRGAIGADVVVELAERNINDTEFAELATRRFLELVAANPVRDPTTQSAVPAAAKP
jgi:uncharacterized protein (UPF0261 family)